MGYAVIYGFVGVAGGHNAVDKTGGKAVSAADAVHNFKRRKRHSLMNAAVGIEHCGPVVYCCGFHCAQGGADSLEIGVHLNDFGKHFAVAVDIELFKICVIALYFKAEASGEILLIAYHNVYIFCYLLIYFLRLFLAADVFPEGRTVIEVVGNDCSVFFGCFNSLYNNLCGSFGKCSKNSAGVKPTNAELTENVLPVNITGL